MFFRIEDEERARLISALGRVKLAVNKPERVTIVVAYEVEDEKGVFFPSTLWPEEGLEEEGYSQEFLLKVENASPRHRVLISELKSVELNLSALPRLPKGRGVLKLIAEVVVREDRIKFTALRSQRNSFLSVRSCLRMTEAGDIHSVFESALDARNDRREELIEERDQLTDKKEIATLNAQILKLLPYRDIRSWIEAEGQPLPQQEPRVFAVG